MLLSLFYSYAAHSANLCLKPNLQTIAKLSGKINVKDAGAKGDYNNDDTDSIQAAINCAYYSATVAGETDGGYVVYFPVGAYKITKGLVILPYVDLIGDGIGWSSVIYPTNLPVADSAIKLDGSLFIGDGWIFSNTISGINIDMRYAVERTAIKLNKAYNIRIVDSYINTTTRNSIGSHTVDTAGVSITNSNHVTLDHLIVTGAAGTDTGVEIKDSSVTAININIEGHATNILVKDTVLGNGKFNMYGGYLERFGGYGIRFINSSYNNINGVLIKVPNKSPHGISFDGTSEHNNIIGVSITCDEPPCTAIWGIKNNNYSRNTSLIMGNIIFNHTIVQ